MQVSFSPGPNGLRGISTAALSQAQAPKIAATTPANSAPAIGIGKAPVYPRCCLAYRAAATVPSADASVTVRSDWLPETGATQPRDAERVIFPRGILAPARTAALIKTDAPQQIPSSDQRGRADAATIAVMLTESGWHLWDTSRPIGQPT
jgi:hypothetical protein